MQYATFDIGGNLFGIPIVLIQEITRMGDVYPVPGHDKRVAGLTNLRGATAVVVDLGKCVFHDQDSDSKKASEIRDIAKCKAIILESNDNIPEEIAAGITGWDEPLVLKVDGVRQIIDGDKLDHYPPPSHIAEEFIDGVIKCNDNLITMISIPKLISSLINISVKGENNGC